MEIDIYAIAQTAFKFCHALDREKVDEVHDLTDGFLPQVVNRFPGVEWFVDLKCLDLDSAPKEMMQYLVDSFGKPSIFISAQQEVLGFFSSGRHAHWPIF